jgi:imidazolonepropionase-like amidohydrolase
MPEPLVLTGATLIDGTGAAPVSGRAVVVQDGRIQAVVGEREAPSGRTLRLNGLTLLPGLINCHVHLCFGGDADPGATMTRESYATTVINATPSVTERFPDPACCARAGASASPVATAGS